MQPPRCPRVRRTPNLEHVLNTTRGSMGVLFFSPQWKPPLPVVHRWSRWGWHRLMAVAMLGAVRSSSRSTPESAILGAQRRDMSTARHGETWQRCAPRKCHFRRPPFKAQGPTGSAA
eukprot:scaffold278011_cov36-Tisochrysis_lutea.AAC.3